MPRNKQGRSLNEYLVERGIFEQTELMAAKSIAKRWHFPGMLWVRRRSAEESQRAYASVPGLRLGGQS